MKYLVIFADAAGESHLKEADWPLRPGSFTPPSPAGYFVTETMPAQAALMMHHPDGYEDAWHRAPERVLGVVLQGRMRVVASDGDSRVLEPGSCFLAADRTGKGHRMEEVDGKSYDLALIVLHDDGEFRGERP